MTAIVNRGSYPLTAVDEERHPVGNGLLWNESHYLDFASADGAIGGYIRLGLYPNWRRSWYWACVARPGRPSIVLTDNHAPLPFDGLAVTAGGFSERLDVLSPLEAARAVLDSPVLGLDLTWRTAGGVYGYDLTPRYEIPCAVSGTIRVDGQEIAFTGHGERDHSWGERDWWTVSWMWSAGQLDDGTFLHAMRANVGTELTWPCFVVPPGGTLEHHDGLAVASTFADDGWPASSRLLFAGSGGAPGADVTVTPLAFATVVMSSPEGTEARFPRAMCRFDAADGRHGYGWAEWHQPPGWRDHGWVGEIAR